MHCVVSSTYLIKLAASAPTEHTTNTATSRVVLPFCAFSLSKLNSIKIRLVIIPRKQNMDVKNDQRTETNYMLKRKQ